MSYSRPSVQAGRGLKRTPATPNSSAVGVFDFTLESDIATTTNVGVVQIGSGLSITPDGILSAQMAVGYQVKLTNVNYTADVDDYYIGATKKAITITLPAGIVGKAYIVKNQVDGLVRVDCSAGQTLDDSNFISLGTNDSIFVIFDGNRWNIV